jgi:hypothetical protein
MSYLMASENIRASYYIMGITIPPDQSRVVTPAWVRPVQASVDVMGFGNTCPLTSSTDFVHLSNVPPFVTASDIPGNLSGFVNDRGYITQGDVPGNLSGFINDAGYITRANVPGNLSGFVNDAGYITRADVPGNLSGFINDAGYITRANVPGNVSAFVNDRGFITQANVPGNLSGFINDQGYISANALVQSDWAQANTSNLSYIANKPGNVSALSNDSGFIVQDSSPTLRGLTITGDLIVANGVLHTNVSPVFNGSFWSISDNPIQKPTALSEALKIGGYIFDAGQVLWDGAQQAQLMFNQGQMADQMAAQTASDVAERLNDPENELTINWSAVSQRPLANQGISQDIGIAGGLFMDGFIFLDGGASVGIDGGVSWGSADRSKKILDVGAQRINLLIANTNSLLCNVGTVTTLTSSEIHTDNVYCLANLVSQGKLVGNIGTFNSVLSNLFTVSTLTTSDSFCGNIFVTGNLQTSGNVSMAQANITSLVGQTATLTGNLTAPSANITSSLQTSNLTLTGNLVIGNSLSSLFTSLSNTGITTNSLTISGTTISNTGNLVAPWSNIATMNAANLSLTGILVTGNVLSNQFTRVSNTGITANSLTISGTTISNTGNLVAPWSNIATMNGMNIIWGISHQMHISLLRTEPCT